jgi:hypothetical protein
MAGTKRRGGLSTTTQADHRGDQTVPATSALPIIDIAR